MSVYKRGKVWWIGYRDPYGNWVRKNGGRTKKLAQDALDIIKGKIRTGDYEAVDVLAAPPFRVAVVEYIRDRKATGKNEDSYEYLDGVWTDALESRAIASITTTEITRRLDDWQIKRWWVNSTRNRVAAQLAGFLSFAIRRDWIKRHPMERGRVPMLEEGEGRLRWLRPDEIALLRATVHALDGIPDDWRQVLDDVIVFAATTAVRFGWVCKLRPSDYADGCIIIDKDKNKRRVHVPIPEGELKALIERRVDAVPFPGSLLFPGPRGGNAHSSIRRWLPKVVAAAGLVWGKYITGDDGKAIRDEHGHRELNPQGITFHTFRHTMASNGAVNGVSDPELQELGNWKDPRMLQRYRHLGNEQIRKAAAKVVAGVFGREIHDTPMTHAENRKESERECGT